MPGGKRGLWISCRFGVCGWLVGWDVVVEWRVRSKGKPIKHSPLGTIPRAPTTMLANVHIRHADLASQTLAQLPLRRTIAIVQADRPHKQPTQASAVGVLVLAAERLGVVVAYPLGGREGDFLDRGGLVEGDGGAASDFGFYFREGERPDVACSEEVRSVSEVLVGDEHAYREGLTCASTSKSAIGPHTTSRIARRVFERKRAAVEAEAERYFLWRNVVAPEELVARMCQSIAKDEKCMKIESTAYIECQINFCEIGVGVDIWAHIRIGRIPSALLRRERLASRFGFRHSAGLGLLLT